MTPVKVLGLLGMNCHGCRYTVRHGLFYFLSTFLARFLLYSIYIYQVCFRGFLGMIFFYIFAQMLFSTLYLTAVIFS